MSSRKILHEMFVSEATLEFPDGEIDAVNRVLAGAARRGAIPRDALENWPIIKGFAPRPKKADPVKPKPKAAAPTTKADSSDSTSPSPRTGRIIPSTNRFRQDEPKANASDEPAPKKDAGRKDTEKKGSDGPGKIKRAVAALRGRDIETGLPKAKPAARKVYGGHGPATNLPRLDRMFGSGEGDEFPEEKTDPEYVSPFAHIPGLSTAEDEPDDDPKTAAIGRGFSKARQNAGPRSNIGFPEADVWDRFAGRGDSDGVDADEPVKPRKQGRLSRLFKGRRDDNI